MSTLYVALAILALGLAWFLLNFLIGEIGTGELLVGLLKCRTCSAYAWSHTFAWRTEPVGFVLNAAGLLAMPAILAAGGLTFATGAWAAGVDVIPQVRSSAAMRVVRVLGSVFGSMWFLPFFGLRALYALHILPTLP
jgi:hypothetical protein